MRKSIFTLCWWTIFLGGAFLRFHALDHQSLWDDEMSTIKTISMSFSEELAHHKVYETHPPLFFIQLRIWKRALGGSLPLLRANSALWGTLSLLALYGLALSLGFTSEAALFVMTLLAFSPFHLAYSQELRPYAMAIFLGILGFWVLEKLIQSEKGVTGEGWAWAAMFFVLTAELYTHYWGVFVACAQGVYGLSRFKGRSRWAWTSLCTASAVLFSFWLPILRDQLHIVGNIFWAYAASPRNLARAFFAFSGVAFRFASSDFFLPGSRISKLVIVGIYTGGLTLGFRGVPRAAALWLVLGLGLPFAFSYWKPALFLWYRYTSLIYPAFLLWVVSGLYRKTGKGWIAFRYVSLGVLLLASLWGCHYYFTGWEKANPKAVVAYVDDQVVDNTVIIRPVYFSDLFSFYNRRSVPVLDQHCQDSIEKRASFRGKNVLLIAFDAPSDPVTDAFRAEFKTVSARHFPGFARLGITVYSLR